MPDTEDDAATKAKKSLGDIVEAAVNKALDTRIAAAQDKQRTTGQTVETEKSKSLFELLGF